jgi:hypothetical protein
MMRLAFAIGIMALGFAASTLARRFRPTCHAD